MNASLAAINKDMPLTYAGGAKEVQYIQLKHVHVVSPIALAPHLTGIKKVGEVGRQGEVEKTQKFYVMPLCH